MKQKHKIYKEAPLVEVIAEIHWKLQKISALPDGAVDPHFQKLREKLTVGKKSFIAHGFPYQEKLVPEEIPLEFLAHKPVLRLRPAQNTWPLVQLGPGILTINTVPPYNGWENFQKVIENSVKIFISNLPIPAKFFDIEKIELRYIDAFTKKHGIDQNNRFLKDDLLFNVALPENIVKSSIKKNSAIYVGCDSQFDIIEPKKSIGIIKIGRGELEKEPAILLETCVRGYGVSLDNKSIVDWFGKAQKELSFWFENITSDSLKKKFGELIQVEE